LVYLLLATALRAETPPDPLRLIPDQADFFVKVDQPRRLLEAFTNNDLVQRLQAIDSVRQLYDSTNARRLYQLITHFEQQLGADRLELLDRLAGGGAVLGIKFGPQPAPAVFVVQSKDEQLLHRFVKLALELAEQELARQESKDRLEKADYRGAEVVQIGKDFYASVASSALILSNKQEILHRALDLYFDGGKNSLALLGPVAEARKRLHKDPLAWAWLNFDSVRKAPGAKEVLAVPGNQPLFTVAAGDVLDQVRRAPFLCAGLHAQGQGFTLSLRT